MFVISCARPAPAGRDDGVDRVPELLAALAPLGGRLAAERTLGDEAVALADRAEGALDIVRTALELGSWRVGLGVGPVGLPLPSGVREVRGGAMTASRAALERARRTSEVPVAVLAADARHAETAADAQAVLRLIGWMIATRNAGQWRTVRALREDPSRTQAELASALGVTQQTVSRALKTSGWREERAAYALVTRLLAMIDLTS